MRAVSIEDGGDEHRARALVDLSRHPLGERLDRFDLQPDDVEPLLVEPRQLTSKRVELAVRGDDPRAPTEVSAERNRVTSSWVFCAERDRARRRRGAARKPSRTRSALANARSHFSSTRRAASSNASAGPREPTSGQA